MIPYVPIYPSSCCHSLKFAGPGRTLSSIIEHLLFKFFIFFTHYWSTFPEGTHCQMKVVHCKIRRQTLLSWVDREQMPSSASNYVISTFRPFSSHFTSFPNIGLGNQPSLFLIWKLDWLVSIFSSGKRTWWTPLEITPKSNRWNPTTVKQLEIGLFRWNPI